MKQYTNLILKPLDKFFSREASGGIVLIATAFITILWANSYFYESLQNIIHFPISLSLGHWHVQSSLLHFVNDGLMVLFFLVVGLEIKREMVLGELSTPKKAIFPIFAALGGMIFPAVIYALFNVSTPTQHGWAIPMATDIAFAVGILSLVSRHVPFSAKVFLLALAIVDDLGAVLIIALFYTNQISTQALGAAFFIFLLMLLCRKIGLGQKWIYFLLAILSWVFFSQSGIHGTITGVILGFITPIDYVDYKEKPSKPLDFWLKTLHPWVSYFVMPTFAFFNAGVILKQLSFSELLKEPVFNGVFLGLLLGKPLGVFLMSFLAEKLKLTVRPQGLSWNKILGIGCISGIGFTMSIFISNLGLPPEFQNVSKASILLGSIASAIIGALILLLFSRGKKEI